MSHPKMFAPCPNPSTIAFMLYANLFVICCTPVFQDMVSSDKCWFSFGLFSKQKRWSAESFYDIYLHFFSIPASGKRRHLCWFFPWDFFDAKTLKCRIRLLCIHYIYETWNLINLIPDSGKHGMTESSAEHSAEIFSKTSEMVPNGLYIPMYES